jgi:uncharacterized protein (TIGR03435 family)
MKVSGRSALPLLLACSCFAQTPRPEFEVASIRPSASTPERVNIGVHIDGSQVHIVSYGLKDYLAFAYRTKTTMITGPDWAVSDRFDLSASLPAGSTTAQLPEMMQALLADRFKLKFHYEKKEFPVYVLLTTKGPLKLKESPANPDADAEAKGTVNVAAGGSAAGVGVNLGHGTSYSFANNRFDAKRLTMTEFAANLERFADRHIVDMTDLTGRYDFSFDVTPEDYQAMLIRAALQAGYNLPPQALRALEGSSGAAVSDALQ